MPYVMICLTDGDEKWIRERIDRVVNYIRRHQCHFARGGLNIGRGFAVIGVS